MHIVKECVFFFRDEMAECTLVLCTEDTIRITEQHIKQKIIKINRKISVQTQLKMIAIHKMGK